VANIEKSEDFIWTNDFLNILQLWGKPGQIITHKIGIPNNFAFSSRIEKKYGGAIVAIKLSSDLMDGQPITEVTLYNVKAREGDADRACSQFQNVFAQISNCIFPNCEIYLSKLKMSNFNNAFPLSIFT